MGDPEIDNIELEQTIFQTVNGSTQAFHKLINSAWMLNLLKEVADCTFRRFKPNVKPDQMADWACVSKPPVQRDDIFEAVLIATLLKIKQVKNPDGKTWSSCLRSWCYSVATNFARNELRRYRNASKHESKIISLSERVSHFKAPDEQLFEKEFHEVIWLVFKSLTIQERILIALWASGKRLQQIHELTGVPVSTIHERQRHMQKTIFKRIGADEILLEAKEYRNGLREIIALTLAEMSGGNYLRGVAA